MLRVWQIVMSALVLCSLGWVYADPSSAQEERWLEDVLPNLHLKREEGARVHTSTALQFENCGTYPYAEAAGGEKKLIQDVRDGLKQGLSCLIGKGPAGYLHPYHHRQAYRLMSLLDNEQPKILQCVRDELFAYAVASSPEENGTSNAFRIKLDLYRLGGLLSPKFDSETYRSFFKLEDDEIKQMLTGKPLRLQGLHRYRKRSELLFHEMVHWLGHVHENHIRPDVTFLYDMCCFGGSEFIEDAESNKLYQTKACNILKDDELWSANSYKKMRLWRFKDYDQFKLDVRELY